MKRYFRYKGDRGEKKQKILKSTIRVISLMLVLILFHFINGSEIVRNQFSPRRMVAKLPKFNTLDINGNPVKSKNFKGKNLYIQFVDSFDFNDINLIKAVYSNWKDENLYIIVITKYLERFKLNSVYCPPKVVPPRVLIFSCYNRHHQRENELCKEADDVFKTWETLYSPVQVSTRHGSHPW